MDPAIDTDPADDNGDLAALVTALIGSRRSVAPKRLQAPGPDAAQLRRMVEAAACAPDHRALRPWRLIRIADHQRDALADLFEACSAERNPSPTPDDRARSREKAYRAPLLLLAVLRSTPADPEVPLTERAVALGAALMNLLLAAHGLGFGAMLTSGRAVRSERFARAFALADDEQAVCFVSIGTAVAARHGARPSAAELLGEWTAGPAARAGGPGTWATAAPEGGHDTGAARPTQPGANP
jgi:nitroreductase